MIHEVDSRLRDWITSILPGITVSLQPPDDGLPDDSLPDGAVSLYLLELGPAPPAGNDRRLPLQVSLRYLVTTRAKSTEQAHQWLGTLLFAAMESADFETSLDPLPAATWAALKLRPQPAFVLNVPLRVPRPAPPQKLVRQPLLVQAVSLTGLTGRLLTPQEVPIPGASVRLPNLQLSAHTDADGYFRFGALPKDLAPRLLLVRAKGRERQFTIEPADTEHQPVIIHFDVTEE